MLLFHYIEDDVVLFHGFILLDWIICYRIGLDDDDLLLLWWLDDDDLLLLWCYVLIWFDYEC